MKFKIWIASILLILIAIATVFLASLQGRGTNWRPSAAGS